MKSLILGMSLLISGSSFAHVTYKCDVKIDGYVTSSVEGIELTLGKSGVQIKINEYHELYMDLGSTGRSNTMPKTRLAYALVAHGTQTINSNAVAFEGLPQGLTMSLDQGDVQIDVNCTLQD